MGLFDQVGAGALGSTEPGLWARSCWADADRRVGRFVAAAQRPEDDPMAPSPTGRLDGLDLIFTRTFTAPIDQVWLSITDPDRTERWIGRWTGDGREGQTVELQMVYEQEGPPSPVQILACRAPDQLTLAVGAVPGVEPWQLFVTLTTAADLTTLTFRHRLQDTAGVADIGPGWEYYLDQLVAAESGATAPDFADYHPAMSAHFTSQR